MQRVLLVSNRLPVTATVNRGRIALTRTEGGLATGLNRIHANGQSVWIGWPGTRGTLGDELDAVLRRRLGAKNLVGVSLGADEVTEFYEGVTNEVVWPAFHYLLDRVPVERQDWDVYERVNDRFAEVIARHHRPGDLVWVHDYHLMRVPALLRRRIPDARIGFFLHVPFPPSDLFRTIAWREPLLDGVLGADLIGFHTATYLRHFAATLLRLTGRSVEIDRVHADGRTVRLGVFPMGVDVGCFREIAERPEFRDELAQLESTPPCALLLAVDRLDYTKGIPRRLLAFERLLTCHPELHGHVRLVQVAAPSRAVVGSYREFRGQVDTLIGRIHGAFATPNWVPVHYIHRPLSETQLAALYRAADVMLVTPLRDGMNLVAKEFVATRADGEGVLVLSEFAGAADELAGALLVNPYDVDATAETYHRALTMPLWEKRARMAALRTRVIGHDLHRWARQFLETLEHAADHRLCRRAREQSDSTVDAAVARIREAPYLVVLLDYDGTLVPFASKPELASPDHALLDLLATLAARSATEVHIVSGRPLETLEEWFGTMDVYLHAEHGLASRDRYNRRWRSIAVPDLSWRESVRFILEEFAERTPGAFVEVKSAGLAWHWRAADPVFAGHQADELRLHLSELLASSPTLILVGDKVLEVLPVGINKGTIVGRIAERIPDDAGWLALGDDTTDEELFVALPDGVVSIHVGSKPTRARYRLPDVSAARAMLSRLVRRETDHPGT